MKEPKINLMEICCDESGHELLSTEKTKRTNRFLGIGAVKLNSFYKPK